MISDAGPGVEYGAEPVCTVEFIHKNGFTGLKTGKTYKKAINMAEAEALRLAVPGRMPQQKQWLLSDLSDNDVDPDYFNARCCDIHDYADVLGWCISVLQASPSARLMLREALDQGWRIGLDDLCGGSYCIDVAEKLLLIDNNALVPSALGRSGYFRNVTIVTLVKALRDIWQEKRHGGFDVHYGPEHIMTLERVRAADCDVMAVLVGWELRSEAYADLWRHLIGSDIGDMAMMYSGHLERDPASAFNGRAAAAAFRQWFRDEARVNACDHDTLEYLDDVLAESVAGNPFGRKKPSRIAVEALSCQPDKSAYLRGLGGDILGDPLYCGMNDPINQSHLFHILYDLEAVIVENVPFRDAELARKIFPE